MSKKKLDKKKIQDKFQKRIDKMLDYCTSTFKVDGAKIIADVADSEFYSEVKKTELKMYNREERLSDADNIESFITPVNNKKIDVELYYDNALGYQNAPEDAEPRCSDGLGISTEDVLDRIREGLVWKTGSTNRSPNNFFSVASEKAIDRASEIMNEAIKKF